MWLSRLSAMSDYKNKRTEVAQLVYQFISKAEENSGFRETFFQCIEGAGETCGDRMALSVLKLGLNYDIEICKTEDNLPKLARLLGHGTMVLSELEGISRVKVESLPLVDEIEVHLAFPIRLREKLKIPIRVEGMLYFACSSITADDLQRAEEIVLPMLIDKDIYFQFLAENGIWQKALETHRPESYNAINEVKSKAEDALDDEQPDYYAEYVKINSNYIVNLKKLIGKILDSHFPFE